MKVERILVPVELSEITGTVVNSAHEMGELLGAPLVFMHVVEPHWRRTSSGYDKDEPNEEEFKTIQTMVEEQVSSALPGGGAPEVEVHCGDPYQIILDTIDRLKIGLIVMGTHGRRGLSHMFLGSVAEKIVQLAPCPVLTVKPEVEDASE